MNAIAAYAARPALQDHHLPVFEERHLAESALEPPVAAPSLAVECRPVLNSRSTTGPGRAGAHVDHGPARILLGQLGKLDRDVQRAGVRRLAVDDESGLVEQAGRAERVDEEQDAGREDRERHHQRLVDERFDGQVDESR
jgi:hypothetical protein